MADLTRTTDNVTPFPKPNPEHVAALSEAVEFLMVAQRELLMGHPKENKTVRQYLDFATRKIASVAA